MSEEQAQPAVDDGGPYAWLMVLAAATIVGVGRGSMLTITVFLLPLEAEFGWLRADTSFAYGAANIMAGVGGIAAGYWADRFSTRSAVLIGTFVLGGSLVMLSMMQSLGEFYLIFGLMLGGFGISTYLAPLITSLGFWFDKNRGLAMSLALVGQSVGSAVVPPFAGYLILLYSWREAYLILAILVWVILLPVCFLLRDSPSLERLKTAARQQPAGESVGGSISPLALVSILSLAMAGGSFCMTIPVVHLVPLVIEYGYDAQTAASVFSMIFISGIAGRIALGKLMEYLGGMNIMILSTVLCAATIFGFTLTQSLPVLYTLAAVFGVGLGGVLTAYAVIIRERVPPHLNGRSVGVVYFFGYAALGVGGYVGGVLYDWTGNYSATYASGAVTGFASVAVQVLLMFTLMRRAVLTGAEQTA